jgi:hypothetical protein
VEFTLDSEDCGISDSGILAELDEYCEKKIILQK